MKLREYKGKIYIKDFCFDDIANQFRTPFYLYDLDTIKRKIHDVKRHFGSSIELFYAVKANSNLEILKAIREEIDGLDISSLGEMEQSLLAGYDPKHLSFAGPGKTRNELEEAISRGIGITSVESMRELKDIREITSAKGLRANIALRLNPNLLTKDFEIKMGGKATQFGIDEEDAGVAINYIWQNSEAFNFLGIHIYAGTQCMNEKALALNLTNTLEIAKNIEDAYGLNIKWINLGGGFGISYYGENKNIDLSALAGPLNAAIDNFNDQKNTRARFILELGRYIVAKAGIYVTRIVSQKDARGEEYFILDGGMNHHLAASGNLGAMLRKNYDVRNLSNPAGLHQTYNLVGPLCTPLDLMGKNVSVESPKIGHLIGFLNSGSYAFTASPLLFLGHETPSELLLTDNEIKVIRPRRKLTDFN